MIRGFFYKFNRNFKNLKNVIFHVKLLSPTLNKRLFQSKLAESPLCSMCGVEDETECSSFKIELTKCKSSECHFRNH